MSQQYNDDDLVYIDPESRTVVGSITWDSKGNPEQLPYKDPPKKQSWRRFYPWGTYKSMKRLYRLEGKKVEDNDELLLDEAIPKLLQDTL